MDLLPNRQLVIRPGMIELGWGHPDPELLPVQAMAQAAQAAFTAHGQDALGYGAEQGPGRLLAALQSHLAQREGPPPSVERLLVTGGISHGLDLLCAQLTQPGEVILVEAPTYHLALRIFRDRGLRVIGVPGDADGMQVDAAAAQIVALRSAGVRVALIYVVSSFGNPSGAILSPARRAALATLAQATQIPVLEDEAYCELWYDTPPPRAIAQWQPLAPVIRLGSFAKILAPGLRLGWIEADPDLIQRCVRAGVLDSGGGVNHLTAHILASLLEQGGLPTQLERAKQQWRERRNALLTGLAASLPADCAWANPQGGYFVWMRLPAGCDAAGLLPIAEAAGVSYIPGSRFFADSGGHDHLRLSFSLVPAEQLVEGARRLGQAIRTLQGA